MLLPMMLMASLSPGLTHAGNNKAQKVFNSNQSFLRGFSCGPAPSVSASSKDPAYDEYLAQEREKIKEEREKFVLDKGKFQIEKQLIMLKIQKLQMEMDEKKGERIRNGFPAYQVSGKKFLRSFMPDTDGKGGGLNPVWSNGRE